MLINARGQIIHIDFGFILTIGPNVAGVIFENAPFKLTSDYMTLIGGEQSPFYNYFHILLIEGFIAVRKHLDEICDLLIMMSQESYLPCFEKFSIKHFRDRMRLNLSEGDIFEWIKQMIHDSLDATRTVWYDDFQKMSNGIAP
jgi:phosphatidylinositol 4-kinase B